MPLIFPNIVKEKTSTVGTGSLVLTGAVPSHFTFAERCSNLDTFYYRISDGAHQEGGLGTYNSIANTVARTTVYFSTLGGTTKISCSGHAKVWIDVLGEWRDRWDRRRRRRWRSMGDHHRYALQPGGFANRP